MGLDTNYADAMIALEAAYCKLDITKMEYAQLEKVTKKEDKKQREKGTNPDPDVNTTLSPLAASKSNGIMQPLSLRKQILPSQ